MKCYMKLDKRIELCHYIIAHLTYLIQIAFEFQKTIGLSKNSGVKMINLDFPGTMNVTVAATVSIRY